MKILAFSSVVISARMEREEGESWGLTIAIPTRVAVRAPRQRKGTKPRRDGRTWSRRKPPDREETAPMAGKMADAMAE